MSLGVTFVNSSARYRNGFMEWATGVDMKQLFRSSWKNVGALTRRSKEHDTYIS